MRLNRQSKWMRSNKPAIQRQRKTAASTTTDDKEKLRRKARIKRKFKSSEWVLSERRQGKERKSTEEKDLPTRKQCAMPRTENIDCLPDEVLSEILQFVCNSEGDAAILTLSLLCRRWRCRRKMHFRWLSSVYHWNKATKEFREKYFVMYEIEECFGCKTRYKDAPGFMKRGNIVRFYSESVEDGHPGYCSHYCAKRCGAYVDPVDNWHTKQSCGSKTISQS